MTFTYTFKIHWFENEEGWYEGAKELIETDFEDSRIVLEIVNHINASKLDELTDSSEIDLILMDYNLSGVKGSDIISSLREKGIFCNIIFYSKSADFEDNLKDKEGVYSTSRDNLKTVLKKSIKHIQTVIENVSTFRGTFITSAIDLENKVGSAVTSFFKLSADKHAFFQEEIIEKEFFNLGSKIKVLSRIGKKLLGSIEKDLTSASEGTKGDLIKLKIKLENTLGIFKDYPTDIMIVRNTLAHSKEIDANGKVVFKQLTTGGEYTIDETFVRTKMRCVVIHSINLDRLISIIGEVKEST